MRFTGTDSSATPSIRGIAPQLLATARAAGSTQVEAIGDLLHLYRDYLCVLASSQLSQRLRRRVNSSDVVQETMLAAYRDFGDFRGSSEQEFLAWLRQVLINCVRQAVDVHWNAQKRDVRREVALDGAKRTIDDRLGRLADGIADRRMSPSGVCQQNELSSRIADQLGKLKPDYRDVIVYRNLQGLSFEEIAQRMDRKIGTTRMLWLRAIDKIKSTYEPTE